MTRVSNFYFSMGDAKRGDEVLETLRSSITTPALATIVEGIDSACALHWNRLDEAMTLAERVLNCSDASPFAVAWGHSVLNVPSH